MTNPIAILGLYAIVMIGIVQFPYATMTALAIVVFVWCAMLILGLKVRGGPDGD